ncbi:MAG TPA: protein kinase [Kofleriaceae bacterium]|nr:protein kinase [Kofleriaceae bacterium]
MIDASLRETLARISARSPKEWETRLQQEFPGDPAMRMQALLWLHADKHGVDTSDAPPRLGEHADERYELSTRLDVGATASVWQAFDRKLGRAVAIKVFHSQDDSEVLDQVLSEARIASDVISDHVVRVLDVNEGETRPYIVMELVGEYDPDTGEIARGAAASACGPRSIEEVVRWVIQVARGVHDAHLRNVFHRDLKPKNVLVTPITRRARVADFGLAISSSSQDVVHPAITLLKGGPTGPLSVRGTPEYMAPEQARGLPLALDPRQPADRDVLVRIDVWGLGAIAYELLSGRPPWLARPELSAWEIAASNEAPPPLRTTRDGERIPPRLCKVIAKAMARDPSHRYATAAALAKDLDELLAHRPTTLDRSRFVQGALWCRRNPHLAFTALVAIALTILASGAYMTVTRLRDARRDLQREVAEQAQEEARLRLNVEQSRGELKRTRDKLAAERQNLSNLESSIAEDREAYRELLDTKDKALRDANHTTRTLFEQLETARSERKLTEQLRKSLEQQVADKARELERVSKDRDRIRRERDAARTERDAALAKLAHTGAEDDPATPATVSN